MKHLLDEETISRAVRRSKNPADHIWQCPLCGNVPPLLLSTGWYVKRPCACQRRTWQTQEQLHLPHTLDEALRLAQQGQTYTWLGREWADEALQHQTFATFDRHRQPKAFDLARQFALNPSGVLALYGSYDLGKTHLLAAIANKAAIMEQVMKYVCAFASLGWYEETIKNTYISSLAELLRLSLADVRLKLLSLSDGNGTGIGQYHILWDVDMLGIPLISVRGLPNIGPGTPILCPCSTNRRCHMRNLRSIRFEILQESLQALLIGVVVFPTCEVSHIAVASDFGCPGKGTFLNGFVQAKRKEDGTPLLFLSCQSGFDFSLNPSTFKRMFGEDQQQFFMFADRFIDTSANTFSPFQVFRGIPTAYTFLLQIAIESLGKAFVFARIADKAGIVLNWFHCQRFSVVNKGVLRSGSAKELFWNSTIRKREAINTYWRWPMMLYCFKPFDLTKITVTKRNPSNVGTTKIGTAKVSAA